MANALSEPKRADELVRSAVTAVLAVYVVTAFLGGYAFDKPRNPLTLSVLDHEPGPPAVAVNVLVCVAVVLTYPLQFYAAVSLLERVIGFGPGATQARDAEVALGRSGSSGQLRSRADERPLLLADRPATIGGAPPEPEAAASVWITAEDGGWASVALRCALVAVTALVAVVVPSLSDLIDIIGAFLAPWLALTIPALLDLCAGLSMKAYPMTPVDVSVASFVLTTSFILAICGTTSVIMAL